MNQYKDTIREKLMVWDDTLDYDNPNAGSAAGLGEALEYLTSKVETILIENKITLDRVNDVEFTDRVTFGENEQHEKYLLIWLDGKEIGRVFIHD